MNYRQFGINLAKARLDKNLSAYELSLRLGHHTSYISKVECGKINISLETIYKICEVLEIEPADLFEE